MVAKNQAVPHQQFLLIAANLVHRALLAPARAESKQRFRALQEGRLIALQSVELEDKSTAKFGLALDHSEYRGRLNFSAFRASLEVWVANAAKALEEQAEIKAFNSQDDERSMIFGITGLTVTDNQPNLMVLGTEPGAGGDATILKLMYLDPAQFNAELVE